MPGRLVDKSTTDSAHAEEVEPPSTIIKRTSTSDSAQGTLTASERTDLLKGKILKWIDGSEARHGFWSQAQYEEHITKWHPGTCSWLYEDESFKTWLTARNPLPILVTNLAGGGKTTLASAVTHQLREKGYQATIFYYSEVQGTKSAQSVFRGLAHDLVLMSEVVPNDLANLYRQEMADNHFVLDSVFTSAQVIEILLRTIKRVHIIVDGLDECYDRKDLFMVIEQLLRAKCYSVVKWLFLSRPDYKIRAGLAHLGVVEIPAPLAAIRADVKAFVSSRTELDLTECFSIMYSETEDFEANFLWALKLIETAEELLKIKDIPLPEDPAQIFDSVTDEDDAATIRNKMQINAGGQYEVFTEFMRKLIELPRSVEGLYVRSLNQLTSLPADKQKIAKRLLAFVVAAERPLKLSELAHALKTTSKPVDYTTVRLLSVETISTLCTDLLIIDYGASPDDPVVRAPHKTVLEFLSADENISGLHKNARGFLVTKEAADRLLGEVCLHYLSHPRYATADNIASIIDQKEHALLRYAASCWHRHLDVDDPDIKLLARVQSFIQSPCFWTCVAVQTYVQPTIFARYVDDGKEVLSITGNQLLPGRPNKIQVGLPLPSFLHSSRAKAFLGMVIQWHHILNTYPDMIEGCRMDRSWEARWPEYWQWVMDNKGEVQTVAPASDIVSSPFDIRLRTSKPVRLCCAARQTLDTTAHLAGLFDDEIVICNCRPCFAFISQTKEAICVRDSTLGRAIEYFLTTKLLRERTSTLSRALGDEWVYFNFTTNVTLSTPCEQAALAVQFGEIDRSRKVQISHASKRISAGIHMISHANDFKIDVEALTLFKEHCLIIYRQGLDSIQHFWRPQHRHMHVVPAFHPTKPWICWSISLGKLHVARRRDSSIEELNLPEPEGIMLDRDHMMYRELHFSKDGTQLWYVLFTIAADETQAQMKHILSVTVYDFDNFSLELVKTVKVDYASCGSVVAPGIMTTWTDHHLCIVLPPLASKPKIVRLPLIRPDRYETLREPVFFPATTLARRPRFVVLSEESYDMMILLLAAEVPVPPEKMPGTYAVPDSAFQAGQANEQVLAPQSRIAWRLSPSDWRPWDEKIDAESDEYSILMNAMQEIMDTFVVKNKPLPVTTRGAMDWKNQANLRFCRAEKIDLN